MKSTFTVKTKDLKADLSRMERVGSRFSKTSMVKISVLPETIEISKQGMSRIIKAETEGLADIMVPALLLKGYLMTATSAVLSFTFKNGAVECGSSIFSSSAITVETIFNLPENDLPINATRLSVLRFAENKSNEEIERLGLTGSIKYAKRVYLEKVQKAAELLKDYDVSFEELMELINKKIKN